MSSSTHPHLLLLGATGRTGRQLLTAALNRGFTVTALARDPKSLADLATSYATKLSIVKATPTSESDLVSVLESALSSTEHLVILSTLGQTRASGSPFSKPTSPKLYMTESVTALLSAISSLPSGSQSRIDKLVVMSMFGAGSSFTNLHCAIKPVMKYSAMSQTIEDHDALDSVVRGQNQVKWVMVRPAMLKEGEAAEVTVRGDEGRGEGWLPSSVTMGSVVEFLLRAVESDEWDERTPVICN